MTTAEKLEKAKEGDRAAYNQLCGESADKLYAAAILALGRREDAEDAVRNAFRDGYASIAQINDGAHLRAWLARELTKHLVAQIKEYRAQGISPEREDAFSQLPSLDRIVCALQFTFGYSEREIALITGLSEETVARKLCDSEKKLGGGKEELLRKIESCRAPASLLSDTSEEAQKPEPEESVPETEKETAAPRDSQTETEKKEIDARTFIGVITAQKIKGKEFLQLMGNTRISNSAYHEIEQNPNLTKGRLIELLEGSPLTSEDYYKLLSAVKRRNELISRRDQAQRERKQAGLFSLDRTFSGGQRKAAEKKDPAATGPFQPLVNTAVLEELSEKEEEPSERFVFPKKEERQPLVRPKPTAKRPEKAAEKPEITRKRPHGDDFDLNDEPEENTADGREKYKGSEFFIDDDVYYKGVNNGKLAFCAVCAALLFAGSFGVRMLTTGSPLPSEPAAEPVWEEPAIASDADLIAAASEMKSRVQRNSLGYYRTSALPYRETLTDDFCETERTLYLHSGNTVRAVALTPENPGTAAELPLKEDAELLGFTAAESRFYLVYALPDGENGEAVCVEVYNEELKPLEQYRQDGHFVDLHVQDGVFTLVTALDPAGTHTRLPSYTLDGSERSVSYTDVLLAENAVCGGFSVIGTVSGGEARVSAVLGGYDCYAVWNGDRIELLLPDWNNTHRETFRLIGTAAELLGSETIPGECWGAECLDETGDRLVVYDSAEGVVRALKRSGGEYAASEGFAAGERLTGVSYTDDRVHVITETADGEARLYCADTSGSVPTAAEPEPSAVYSEKLAAYGENLIGLSAVADESGARTGLRLSVYGYDGALTLLRSAEIRVDENTAAEYACYLAGDAEGSPLRIAVSEDASRAAVSCVYFDGISEIERFLCFRDSGEALEKTADFFLYDVQSDYRYCAIRGDLLYAVTDTSVHVIELDKVGKEQA